MSAVEDFTPTEPDQAPGALSKRRLKAWIRLLGVTRATETRLRDFLRVDHDTTLPRFDVMAALYRRSEPISMSDLSRMLLVSNGNATAVINRLEKDGLVVRQPLPTDRRTVRVGLTELGRERFEAQARDHEREIDQLFAGLTAAQLDDLEAILKQLGTSRR